MKSLPPRQQDVLNAIVELTDQKGFPPSLAELARELGLKNRMTVHQHVAALKKKGLVSWESGLNRSLTVLEEGLKYVTVEAAGNAGGHYLGDDSQSPADREPVSIESGIPLRGRIAAGSPIDAHESPEFLTIETDYAGSGCYALQVKGDSMVEDGIYEGDFVIVKPNPSPHNGEIVVALLEDGTATLKRFYKENGRFRLQPANSSMEPIFIERAHDLNIQGTVVGLFRRI
ncbi:MAG: transcriptional repressor LexA [Cyanobacteria bacterium HKST-UBA02]|nr:transcriptional repressor LexA [Cyanobacteria bacterium HKST-UBA02]